MVITDERAEQDVDGIAESWSYETDETNFSATRWTKLREAPTRGPLHAGCVGDQRLQPRAMLIKLSFVNDVLVSAANDGQLLAYKAPKPKRRQH